MKKFIVLDDVFNSDVVNELKSIEHPVKTTWIDKSQRTVYDYILNVCRDYVDLTDYSGYEIWRNRYPPGRHVDKNEELYELYNVISYPICNIVYYLSIENLQGGELNTEDLILKPKNNRLVIFTSEIQHAVNNYIGNRVAISINPWKENPKITLERYKKESWPSG